MLKIIFYLWRWVFTFLAYFLYGFFSILAGIIFFIPFLILPKKIKKKLAQFLVHLSYLLLTKFLIITGVMNIKVDNKKLLQDLKGTLVIANHPSFLDIVVLMSILPRADCLVKASLWKNPFIGWVVRASQYIVSDNPLLLVDTCMERLRAGNNIVIFPEGTRSNLDSLKDFQRIYASIAINCECNLVPVFLQCTPPALTKQCRWYRIPSKKFIFDIIVFPPINLKMINNNGAPVSSKEFSAKIEQFFTSLMKNTSNSQLLFQQYFVEKL